MLKNTLGGLANATFWDSYMHRKPGETFSVPFQGKWDQDRLQMGLLNALLGVGGTSMYRHGIATNDARSKGVGVATAALSPGKDLILNSLSLPGNIEKGISSFKDTANNMEKLQQGNADMSKTMKKILLGAAVGGLGLGALGVGKYLTRKDPEKDIGRISVSLPSKDKKDGSRTTVDVPMSSVEMSPALLAGIGRDVRKTLRKGVKERSFKRDPNTGELIPFSQYKAKYPNMADDGEVISIDDMPVTEGEGIVMDKAASVREALEEILYGAAEWQTELNRRKFEEEENGNKKLTKEASAIANALQSITRK